MVDISNIGETVPQEKLKIHGPIESIAEIKRGRNKNSDIDWILYKLNVDGIQVSGFGSENNDPYQHFKKGEVVEIEYVVNGSYKNIQSVKPYNPEGDKLYKDYLENALNSSEDKKSPFILQNGVFCNELEIDGELYEIILRKKE